MRETLKRTLVMLYGTIVYAMFGGVFLYAAGWVSGVFVPRSVDTGPASSPTTALLVNTALLGLFAVQHTGMARAGFKRWWTRFVPAPVERATYVLATNLAFVALFLFWRPLPATIWEVGHPVGRTALHALGAAGWVLVFLATCMINHFELFGLRQVWLRWRGRPHAELGFRAVGLYRFVRHPIQLGFLIAFWATPHMTAGHLLFAIGTTAYILVALLFFEEPDLVREFGDRYRIYRDQVAMFLPLRRYRSDRV